MAVAKEQIRQIISENNINSVADIYTLLKDSFKDILQELMEAELDATLGYEKNWKTYKYFCRRYPAEYYFRCHQREDNVKGREALWSTVRVV